MPLLWLGLTDKAIALIKKTGYIRISQSPISSYVPLLQGLSSLYIVLKQAGICAGILRSPTIRKMMSEKASNVRNPLALFLAILMILFNPSAIALVNLVSTNGNRRSVTVHSPPLFLPWDYERSEAFSTKGYRLSDILPGILIAQPACFNDA